MFSWNEVLLEFLNSFWPGISAEGFLLVFQFFDQFRSNACSHHTLEDLKSGHDAPVTDHPQILLLITFSLCVHFSLLHYFKSHIACSGRLSGIITCQAEIDLEIFEVRNTH